MSALTVGQQVTVVHHGTTRESAVVLDVNDRGVRVRYSRDDLEVRVAHSMIESEAR